MGLAKRCSLKEVSVSSSSVAVSVRDIRLIQKTANLHDIPLRAESALPS